MIGSPERPSVRALSWRSSGDPGLCDRVEIVEIDEEELLIIGKCGSSESSQRWRVCRRSSRSPLWGKLDGGAPPPRDPRTRPSAVAVISYLLSGYEAKTREAGCNRYIAKPFSPASYIARCPARS
jgi:hypothetical protein